MLCVQDGTELNFAEHPGCAGLGYIGKNKRSEGTLGLHMHSTLAVSPEGIPLGLLHIPVRRARTGRRSAGGRWSSARPSAGSAGCATARR